MGRDFQFKKILDYDKDQMENPAINTQEPDSVPVPESRHASTAIRLYLDLLKASITDTVFADEPDVEDEIQTRYVQGFIRHYIKGSAVSMCPLVRFENIEACIVDVLERGIPGDMIETGVWRGGISIFMRGMLKAYEISDRRVWVADSFEGLPEPDAERFPLEAQAHSGKVMNKVYEHFAVSVDEVQRNFRVYGLLDEQVRFLKGWFKDTLPTAPIDALSIMRLDGDYYESTMDALTSLYDKLSIGGYAIIDDYGEDSWTYCRKAVDDFRRERGIDDPVIRVDSNCSYWKRTR